jgi:O-antigen/teichoic acid export membrane protein
MSTPEASKASEASFGSGARVLAVGIASTGIFTFAYLATASHVLSPSQYSEVSLVWAVMFVILSVIYRPIDQLLARTIADGLARGRGGHPLWIPAILQATFAAIFFTVALVLHGPIQRSLGGSAVLYWVLVIGVLAYAGSYFARGWLAGHEAFALYGALVFLEAFSRYAFALAAALGIERGLGTVALGMAVAPFVSLAVIPFALPRMHRQLTASAAEPEVAAALRAEAAAADTGGDTLAGGELTLREGTGFATSLLAIMLSEQALMNAGVLIVAASLGANSLSTGLTGFVFDVMLIVRAPLQLFQAVQTSILPHLTGLEARERGDAFRRAVRITVLASGGFGIAVALGLLAVGPPVMAAVLGHKGFHYERIGIAVVGLGMGFHLVAGTYNQAQLARGQAGRSALCWVVSAGLFVAFQLVDVLGSRIARVEYGYCGATLLLCLLQVAVDQIPPRPAGPARQSAPAASASAA